MELVWNTLVDGGPMKITGATGRGRDTVAEIRAAGACYVLDWDTAPGKRGRDSSHELENLEIRQLCETERGEKIIRHPLVWCSRKAYDEPDVPVLYRNAYELRDWRCAVPEGHPLHARITTWLMASALVGMEVWPPEWITELGLEP